MYLSVYKLFNLNSNILELDITSKTNYDLIFTIDIAQYYGRKGYSNSRVQYPDSLGHHDRLHGESWGLHEPRKPYYSTQR